MKTPWIYRVGLSTDETSEVELKNLGFKYELVEIESALREHIDETLGKPYKFYTSMREDAPDFFSCSSLVSYLYVFAGIHMPSLSVDKYKFFKKIEKEDLKYGDLVFSHNDKERESPDHLGMYLGDGKIIQAAGYWYLGKVVIENLEESPSFKNRIGYCRVVDDIKEKRFVVEIPEDKPDLRNKVSLLQEIQIRNKI